MSDRPWYRRTLVGLEVGPTGAQFGIDPERDFAARFDGGAIVAASVTANAEYLVIWAKDNEFAYYDSRVVPKAPGLGARDVLRESVTAAAPHALPIIAYCQVQYPAYLWGKCPEYRAVDATGKAIPGRICYNSGYLEHVQQVAVEILAYGVDGFHFDMVDQGFGPPYSCWCERCRAAFEAEFGTPMPPALTWDADGERLREFRYNSSARFEAALTAFVRQAKPGTSVDFNYHGSPPFSWETGQRPVQHAHVGDFVTGECGLWAFGPLHTSLAALFAAATKPGAVYQVVMQRSARTYHDMTTRPVADIRWEAMTLLAHGAQVTVVDKTPYDGALDPVVYARVGEVFAEARAKRELFGHRPLAEVGVYYSARSRDAYGRDDPDKYQRAFVGAHRALVYEHLPMGVLLDENVTAARLRQFPVVWLPNVAVLTDDEVALLRDYVRDGGALLATGQTGLYDRHGEPRPTCALGDLIGGEFVGLLPGLDNHVAWEPSAVSRQPSALYNGRPFLVHGPAAVFRATTATAIGQLYRPHRTLQQRRGTRSYGLPLSADAPVGPAALLHTYGKGTVCYLACSPDVATAGEYRTAEPRQLIRQVIRGMLNPTPAVEVDAPLNVEAVVTEDGANRRLLIHLIGYLSPPACTGPGRPHSNHLLPSLMEEAPLYRAAITIRRPFREIRALHPETEVSRCDGGARLLVNEIHETLIVSY